MNRPDAVHPLAGAASKRPGAAGQILSWVRGMPLLNWLATELDSVLLMVEHRANHMALRVRFPRKNLAVLALPSDGAKAPRPGTPERAAQGE
jgi:hypothetical protein